MHRLASHDLKLRAYHISNCWISEGPCEREVTNNCHSLVEEAIVLIEHRSVMCVSDCVVVALSFFDLNDLMSQMKIFPLIS